MKKIFITILLLLFGSLTAHAENDDNFGSKFYFEIIRGFEPIETKDIITSSESTFIYIDSDELTKKIVAVTLPLNSTEKPITYSSNSTDITVDSRGFVTSNGVPAQAEITITSGDVSIKHKVYAVNSIRKFSLSDSELTMYADRPEPYTLSVISEPTILEMDMIDWHSGDEAIAHVDDNGRVIPNGVGTTSIYASTPDGEHTAKCTVYVGLYDVRTQAVFITNAIDKIRSGADYKLSSYVYPETVNDKSVLWTSSNSNVVSVSADGTIHGGEQGTAVISVETSNGKKDSFEIEVVASGTDNIDYKIVSKSVSERIADLMTKPVFIKYNYTLNDMADYQMSFSPVKYSEDRLAEKSEVIDELDPSNHAGGYGKYQFIDLSQSNNISVDTLNMYLNGKGILQGKGQVFKDAAQSYGISELYLVTHACLETGDGSSQLANGIDVNGTVVYNMFGIGAYDADAVKYGSQYAYKMGWTDVDKAIYGGAAWISANYINNSTYKQNTLYKMRWNPDSPGDHQYATDIEWATAQAKTLKAMFDAFPEAVLTFEIPLYEGENEFDLK